MPCKESAEMALARKLVKEDGMTPYAAAKKAGITPPAVYMSKWYKEWRDNVKK